MCYTGVPEIVRRTAKTSIDAGFNIHTRFHGLVFLREAVVLRLVTKMYIRADTKKEIPVSGDATVVLKCACLIFVEF